jgi:hypothetical protein
MMAILAMLLVVIAVGVGIHEGRRGTRFALVAGTGLAIMALSNLLASWPWFVPDQPRTWWHTYVTGLAFMGAASAVVHVVPFGVACCLARRSAIRAASRAAELP